MISIVNLEIKGNMERDKDMEIFDPVLKVQSVVTEQIDVGLQLCTRRRVEPKE